jgi:outer membrane protein OmpA-like peptidoglycan-associated protein
VIFGSNEKGFNDLDAQTIAQNESIFSFTALILKTHSNYRLRLEGHANPVTHPDDTAGRLLEQSLELLPISEMRARAVADRIAQLGIDPERLEVYGFGGERPVAAWEDRGNWQKNRRVELFLTE